MSRLSSAGFLFIAIAMAASGCGSSGGGQADAGPDAGDGGPGLGTTDAGADAGSADAGPDAGLDGGQDAGFDAGVDGGAPDSGADAGPADAGPGTPPLSTLICELSERPGPIPQPPTTLVADFGSPVRLPTSFNDPCPTDAIEVSADGKRIYHYYAVNLTEVLLDGGRLLRDTEVRFRDLESDAGWGPPHLLDLRKGDLFSGPGETRVAPDGGWVIWHALSAQNYGYVNGLPAGQGFDLDLFEAPMSNGVPGPGTHLGPEVNSVYLEGEHWATDDGRTLYFASNRPGGNGTGNSTDIWKISRNDAGIWGSAAPLPSPVNSTSNELQATFSPDGGWIYFVSDRGGGNEIWRAPASLDGGFGAAERVLSPYVGEPSFASNGRLFFVHIEIDFTATPPAVYDADVYYVDPQ